jgi:hypothetical protein
MKNFKLAFTDNTTFYGKDLEGFYANSLLKGASKESFKLIPDVKSTAKIAKLNLGSILQDADCSFNATGEGTLSQKTVTAQDVKINLEYCQRTFERDYLSMALRAGSNSDASIMPASVEEFLLEQVAKKISNDLEYITWQGSGATVAANFVSEIGLQAKLLGDGEVIDVSATTLSSTNIVAQINRVYDVIPAAVKESPELVIYMNAKTAGMYKQAQAASYTGFYSEDQKLTFLGVPIIVAGGLGDNKMVAAEKTNLLLLTDLMSDFSEVLVLPQKSVTGAPVIRMVGDFKFGVDYVYGAEIVYYN